MAAVCINNIDIGDNIIPRLIFLQKDLFTEMIKNNFFLFLR